MICGKVIGQIWSSKHIATLPSGGLLEVETEKGIKLVAFDPLGCAKGETVLVTQGSVAAGYFTKVNAPFDALIIGSIEK